MSEKTFVTFTFHAPFLRKLLENIYQPNKRNKSGNGIQKTEDGEGGGNPPRYWSEAWGQSTRRLFTKADGQEKQLPHLPQDVPKEKTLRRDVVCAHGAYCAKTHWSMLVLIIVQLLLQTPRDSVHLIGEKQKFSFC